MTPDNLFASVFGGGLVAPPESVPRRLLGLSTEGSIDADGIRSAFRLRVRLYHPDLADHAADTLSAAGERLDVAELVWARDDLLHRVRETDKPRVDAAPPSTRNGVTGAFRSLPSSGGEKHPSRRPCKHCNDSARIPSTPGPLGLSPYAGEPYRQHVRGRWAGWCWHCSGEEQARIRRERSRDRLLRRRADRTCTTCGKAFTPARADGRYCSPACRQRSYRARRAEVRA
jgi:hypothetical protein